MTVALKPSRLSRKNDTGERKGRNEEEIQRHFRKAGHSPHSKSRPALQAPCFFSWASSVTKSGAHR